MLLFKLNLINNLITLNKNIYTFKDFVTLNMKIKNIDKTAQLLV